MTKTGKDELTEALLRSEARLIRAELASKTGNWELYPDTKIIHCSEGAKILFGLDTNNFQYSDIIDRILPQYHTVVADAMKNLLESNYPYDIEFQIKSNRTGEIIYIHSLAEFDRDNQIVFGVVQNITERKKTEEQAIHAKELYLKIFENFPALIWRSGQDKACDYFNETWLEFTGRSLEQELGYGWTEGIHPDDYVHCIKTYIDAFDKQVTFVMDYRIRNKSGEYRWIRDYGRPFYDLDNNFYGYIGSCYDITDNRNNEINLIELNSTRDKLFSIIAHDLKSPFSGILGFSELLMENLNTYDTETVLEFITLINSSAEQTFILLENLLAWGSAQTRQNEFNPEILNLETVIKEIANVLYSSAKLKNIALSCFIEEKIVFPADINMLKTILRNLIQNAIKFTNPGGKVDVTAFFANSRVVITIADNGVGMDDVTINRLFQFSMTTIGTANEKGSGLGLSICKEFVEKHGGNIVISSEVGKGSKFVISLPESQPKNPATD